MIKLRYFIASLLLAIVLSGCQNNGDIGYLFGTWRLDSFTIDGVSQPDAVRRTLISFQNDIIMVQDLIDDDGSYANHIGQWSEVGSTMSLFFPTHPDNNAFSAPAWLGWPDDSPVSIAVSDRSSRSVTWTYIAPDGATYIYKLHKTW